jgi:7,8-dihydroneopterin aldolase/epimerase/oxygenase
VDRIELRGVRAHGRHGAETQERARPQPFDIDVVATLDLSQAAASDDLEATMDYAALHARLVRIVETTSFALIERLAAELLDAIFEERRVVHAEVTIAKPAILDGATPSVTLARVNPNHRPS